MKIGFDAKRAFQNTRGLGNYSRNLIGGLLKFYPDNDYFLFGHVSGKQVCADWYSRVAGIVQTVQPASDSSLRNIFWRSYLAEDDIYRNQLDIYHGLSHEIPFKKKNSHTKYVVTIHDLLFMRFPGDYNWLDRKIYLSKIKYSCKQADLILAASNQTRNDLIGFLNVPEEKIVVNYQSCSELFYQKTDETRQKEVKAEYSLPDQFYLFVGAMVKYKNIDRIVEALAILPEAIRYPLVIVGKETAYKRQLNELIGRLGLQQSVQFIDYVRDEDLPAVYQMATLLVWPSLFEGFGIPIIEALFSRLPVITSNLGCFPEVGGENSCYVNPLDAGEIAAAMEAAVSDPVRYFDMQEKGYAFAQKFHIKNTSAHLMGLYSTLTGLG